MKILMKGREPRMNGIGIGTVERRVMPSRKKGEMGMVGERNKSKIPRSIFTKQFYS